jgi:hypothetical protein
MTLVAMAVSVAEHLLCSTLLLVRTDNNGQPDVIRIT